MADIKTKANNASVADYIASRANAQQQADCRELMALMKKITGKPARMWGPSMVGYGSQSYTYASGRSGEMPLACFAIRGCDIVVYLYADSSKQKVLLSKVGKHKMGKVCMHFKQMADLDKSVLEKLVVGSIEEFQQRYG